MSMHDDLLSVIIKRAPSLSMGELAEFAVDDLGWSVSLLMAENGVSECSVSSDDVTTTDTFGAANIMATMTEAVIRHALKVKEHEGCYGPFGIWYRRPKPKAVRTPEILPPEPETV